MQPEGTKPFLTSPMDALRPSETSGKASCLTLGLLPNEGGGGLMPGMQQGREGWGFMQKRVRKSSPSRTHLLLTGVWTGTRMSPSLGRAMLSIRAAAPGWGLTRAVAARSPGRSNRIAQVLGEKCRIPLAERLRVGQGNVGAVAVHRACPDT